MNSHLLKVFPGFLLLLFATYVNAAIPLVLDSFDQPLAIKSKVAFGTLASPTHQFYFNDLISSVPGGIRGSTYNVYNDPLNSISVYSIGKGRMSVAQGTGAMAESLISYGAFTRPQPNVGGPLLGLDLSVYDGLKFDFTGTEDAMNINVVYYTSAPLNPAAPLYYASSGVNIAPSVSGGLLSFVLDFNKAPEFNWTHVDGIIVIINRSGPIPHTSYTLDKLTFVSK